LVGRATPAGARRHRRAPPRRPGHGLFLSLAFHLGVRPKLPEEVA
jgi:hypothetical protein